MLRINLKGVFFCMKHEIAKMLENGGGAVVNLSSVAALRGSPTAGAYAATKAGIVALTRTAALEYCKQGIRINAVCPGTVRTPMTDGVPGMRDASAGMHPIGRIAEAQEVADAVVWLCSDQASFVVGDLVPVDGGFLA
jgi:NAD(P)-dependent dehydrogenase (short-subunit alcohol dehydrogenase family)